MIQKSVEVLNAKRKNDHSEIPDLRISQQNTILRRPDCDYSCDFPIHYDHTSKVCFTTRAFDIIQPDLPAAWSIQVTEVSTAASDRTHSSFVAVTLISVSYRCSFIHHSRSLVHCSVTPNVTSINTRLLASFVIPIIYTVSQKGHALIIPLTCVNRFSYFLQTWTTRNLQQENVQLTHFARFV